MKKKKTVKEKKISYDEEANAYAVCLSCGKTFKRKHPHWKRKKYYCSQKCMVAAYNKLKVRGVGCMVCGGALMWHRSKTCDDKCRKAMWYVHHRRRQLIENGSYNKHRSWIRMVDRWLRGDLMTCYIEMKGLEDVYSIKRFSKGKGGKRGRPVGT